MKRRWTIRSVAAVLAGATAIMYFLIGVGAVLVLDAPSGTPLAEIKLLQADFAIPAAIAFMLGALLLVTFDHRILWILGALLQLFIIYTYFDLAALRTPTFEVWGILIWITQVLLLVALAYLAVRSPPTRFDAK